MKIFLNAGHGGSAPGAISKNGLKEKDVCLKICNILADELKKNGYSVVLYQEKKSYFEITKEENKSKSDLFISVHCNSYSNASACGTETLYYPTSSKAKKLAQSIQDALTKNVMLTDRGIKARNDLHVLKRTVAPAVLIETAFISNPNEERLLKDNPELFAKAIFEGIKNYVK